MNTDKRSRVIPTSTTHDCRFEAAIVDSSFGSGEGKSMNIDKRYRVIPTSTTHHCCFEATVVDSSLGSGAAGDYNVATYGYDFDWLCECFSVEDAQRIADALNAQDALLNASGSYPDI